MNRCCCVEPQVNFEEVVSRWEGWQHQVTAIGDAAVVSVAGQAADILISVKVNVLAKVQRETSMRRTDLTIKSNACEGLSCHDHI